MQLISDISHARNALREGSVLAYPTEAVYGLGCAAFNEQGVKRILALKQRPVSKGLIILIADWAQLTPLIAPLPDALFNQVRATWPGPVTWVFPKSASIPDWLCGEHDGIAVRMSAHPIAHQLCEDGPIVSTSANINGQEPARHLSELQLQFPQGIDAVVMGELGGASQPTSIFDIQLGLQLR